MNNLCYIISFELLLIARGGERRGRRKIEVNIHLVKQNDVELETLICCLAECPFGPELALKRWKVLPIWHIYSVTFNYLRPWLEQQKEELRFTIPSWGSVWGWIPHFGLTIFQHFWQKPQSLFIRAEKPKTESQVCVFCETLGMLLDSSESFLEMSLIYLSVLWMLKA